MVVRTSCLYASNHLTSLAKHFSELLYVFMLVCVCMHTHVPMDVCMYVHKYVGLLYGKTQQCVCMHSQWAYSNEIIHNYVVNIVTPGWELFLVVYYFL